MRAGAIVCLATAASCGALALVAQACTFPEVTFADLPPDGSSFALDTGDDATPIDAGDAGEPTPDAELIDLDADTMPLGDTGCNFNGTWGTRITIDVTWQPQGLSSAILQSGQGTITQWVKGLRTQTATAPMLLSDDSEVCNISLPDFQATLLGLNEVYGVRFPASLFDDMYVPAFTVNGALTAQPTGGFSYSTTPTAVLLGLTMASPTTDPWPSTITTEDDQDHDGKDGVTVGVAQGNLATPVGATTTYSYIPTGVPPPLQPITFAKDLFLAIRQVTVATGLVKDCNTILGTVSIPVINDKPAIDSHVLGCDLLDGGECTTGSSSQASFIDNSQPVFTPSGTTTFEMIRMPPNATCAQVRAAKFP